MTYFPHRDYGILPKRNYIGVFGWGFCVRNGSSGLGYLLHIWVGDLNLIWDRLLFPYCRHMSHVHSRGSKQKLPDPDEEIRQRER